MPSITNLYINVELSWFGLVFCFCFLQEASLSFHCVMNYSDIHAYHDHCHITIYMHPPPPPPPSKLLNSVYSALTLKSSLPQTFWAFFFVSLSFFFFSELFSFFLFLSSSFLSFFLSFSFFLLLFWAFSFFLFLSSSFLSFFLSFSFFLLLFWAFFFLSLSFFFFSELFSFFLFLSSSFLSFFHVNVAAAVLDMDTLSVWVECLCGNNCIKLHEYLASLLEERYINLERDQHPLSFHSILYLIGTEIFTTKLSHLKSYIVICCRPFVYTYYSAD